MFPSDQPLFFGVFSGKERNSGLFVAMLAPIWYVLSGSLENMIYMIAVTVVLMCLTMAIICFATNINLYV